MKYTADYLYKLEYVVDYLEHADAVLIGAGAGLSTAAGYDYSGKRFQDNFQDFIDKYGFSDMYSGGFYHFPSLSEFWAYWSRYIYINRYNYIKNTCYDILLDIIKDKNYFIITTNVDHKFQQAGIDKQRLFYMQGDYGLLQCSKPCHNKTYDNYDIILNMVLQQKNMKVPDELIPYCPLCSSPLLPNLRADNTFVEDDGWHKAEKRFLSFLEKNIKSKILYLELGVGYNTPGIIKYSFWRKVAENKNSLYVPVNLYDNYYPKEIKDRTLSFNMDINNILNDILHIKQCCKI